MVTTLTQSKDRATARSVLFFDPTLLIVYLLLVAVGIVTAYSATIAQAFEAGDSFLYMRKNLVNLLFALTAMLVASLIPVRFWQKTAPLLLLGGIGLLALVFVPSLGVEVNGSNRWIRVANFNFQPSEIAELAFIVFTADYISSRRNQLNATIVGILPILGVFSVFSILLLLEPDFGSTVVLGAALMCLLYLNGMRLSHMAMIAGAGVLAIAVLVVLEPYRLTRLLSFMDPFEDPFDTGFQLTQSLIAFGRGEIFGVGLGNSVQKLFYLPYAGSDFLLAIIAEELGFIGIFAVISLFVVLTWRIFRIGWLAGATGDHFAMVMCQGIAILIAVSAMINMGVNMGVLPTKGLTLPFMSEGGTSLIAYSAAIGMIFSVERRARRVSEQ
ncbi:MAG: putative lipid II flippase FtsW [Acidiferrobacterales bacterium]|nr:putative lipid II flippase FtsW [Acidiferrobacterales bacterium]